MIMGFYEVIKEDLFLILTIVLYALMLCSGYRKGFVKMAASLVSVAASIAIAVFLTPILTERMQKQNAWNVWVDANVLPHLQGVVREQIFSAIAFIVLFIIALALLKILAATLDRIARLPLLSFLNSILGLLLAFCEATVYVWVAMLLVGVMPHIPFCEHALSEISGNTLLTVLYENNLIGIFLNQLIH